jgi:release factor glutamine methyltransferase
MSGTPTIAPMTLGDAVAAAAAQLAAAGIESPRHEARLLVQLAADLDAAAVLGYPERALGPAAQNRFDRLLARRVAREPFSRLVGRREFWSRDFALSADTLDPRPDSETLIEAVLDRLPDRGAALSLLDLGTGTGCLLLALLSELPHASGFGTDLVPGAVSLARANALSIGLESRAFFAVSDWGAALAGGFDVVICNPPYIASAAIAGLAPEVVRFDPPAALDGGPDGLGAYRALAPQMTRLLRASGFACIELGDGQTHAAAEIFRRHGLVIGGVHRDLAGVERCLLLEPCRHAGTA